MSVAYVVLSHQHPEQVLRLARTLRRGSPESTSLRPIYEGSTDWLTTLARLRELGFRPAQLTSVGRDDGLGLLELDCLLVREDAG